EDYLVFLEDSIKQASELAGTSPEEYLHDLGMERIQEEIYTENGIETVYDKKKNEKLASDTAYDYVEKVAEEMQVEPYSLVYNYGLQTAAETLDELIEKEAANTRMGYGGHTAIGAGVGAGIGAGIGALKAKKGEKGKGALKGGLIGAGAGAAAGA